ncbi:ParB-like nuclease domain protein [Mycobacterium phage GaugeLDP]|nr:ParB-like nuclease domain protein [Mycobacterium phage GaugeLDP]
MTPTQKGFDMDSYDDFMTTAEVAKLYASDCESMGGVVATVEDSGPILDEYYQHTPRYNFRGGVTGHFWTKVNEVAEILKGSDTWPFEPIEVSSDRKVLYDGHHRSNGAILAGWDKPIPIEVW